MRYLMAMVLVAFVGIVACSKEHGVPPLAEAPKVSVDQLALKVDPYCGMSVEKHAIAATADHQGKTYGFCSTFCKDEFVKDPEKYLANPGAGGMK